MSNKQDYFITYSIVTKEFKKYTTVDACITGIIIAYDVFRRERIIEFPKGHIAFTRSREHIYCKVRAKNIKKAVRKFYKYLDKLPKCYFDPRYA